MLFVVGQSTIMDKKLFKEINQIIEDYKYDENTNPYNLFHTIDSGKNIVIFGFGFSGSGKTYTLIEGDKKNKERQDFSLLEYFIRRDAQAIIDVYNRALGFVEEKSLLQELIYQMLVYLLVKVMQSNAAFKPTLIRSVLEEALELFPSNTLLLTIFGMTEGKNRLDARMRRFLNDQLSK